MPDIHLTPENTGGPKCDFCSSPDIVKTFETERDFVIVEPNLTHDFAFDTGWAACPVCAGLVEARDHDGLLNHSVETFYTNAGGGLPRSVVRSHIAKIHTVFWKLLKS